MVKTDDALKQKVFDLGLKVEVLKEKKQDGNKKSCFFLLKNSCLLLINS
jgi:hypothetical protein